MAFAAISGVAQLTALCSFTRSVRLRTILLGVGVGKYGSGVLAVVPQYPPNPTRRPDHLIDGEFRDVFAPRTSSPSNAIQDALDKVSLDGQTQRIDIVLDPARTSLTMIQLKEAFEQTDLPEIDSLGYQADDNTNFPTLEITVLDTTTMERTVV